MGIIYHIENKCKCGSNPRLVYVYESGGWKRIIRCPKCGRRENGLEEKTGKAKK